MILSCPVYVYGLFVLKEPNANNVLPPILLNSVYLMLTPKFFKPFSTIHRLNDRAGIMLGVIIASVGITINGIVLSSSDSYYLIGIICYSGLGGKYDVALLVNKKKKDGGNILELSIKKN